MKTIDNFILERLHLNSDSKLRKAYCIYNSETDKLDSYDLLYDLLDQLKKNKTPYINKYSKRIIYMEFESIKERDEYVRLSEKVQNLSGDFNQPTKQGYWEALKEFGEYSKTHCKNIVYKE